jgi:low affinity Fe/Cu permease
MGSPWAFIVALLCVVVWAVAGPYFDFDEAWQLVINTGTTILTFLMVFLIQATQNRDAKALSIKIDELLRAVQGARTGFVNIGDLSDDDLQKIERELQRLGKREGVSPLRNTECDSAAQR